MVDELARAYGQMLRRLRDRTYGQTDERATVGRRLAAYRVTTAQACAICGTSYAATDSRARYCSAACRQRAYRARRDSSA